MQTLPAINEIVGLLDTYDTVALEALQKKFPAHQKVLSSGIIAGEGKEDSDQKVELQVRSEVCKSGLELILKRSTSLLPKLKSRVRFLNRCQLFSQVIVAIGGATIIGLLKSESGKDKMVSYFAASLTLIGSILSILIQYLSGSILANSKSVNILYENLVDYKIEAQHYLDEITILMKLGNESSMARMATIISDANHVSLEIRKIIERL